jgi:hypothetical protein
MSRPNSAAPPPKPQLNWIGQVLVALVLSAWLAVAMYGGLMTGLLIGLGRAEPKLNAPGKGVGMAPDLGGLADATADVVLGYVGGLAGGLVVGLVLGWLAYRFALKPLALAVPGLRRGGSRAGILAPESPSPPLTRPGS